MKAFILITILASISEARIKPYVGTTKQDNPEYGEIFTADGRTVSKAEAFTAVINGQQVLKCIPQEVSLGKSGSSASLKNVKKKI